MEDVKEKLEQEESFSEKNIFFCTGRKVPYSFEILNYKDDEPGDRKYIKYETDLLVYQKIDNEKRKICNEKYNTKRFNENKKINQNIYRRKNIGY